MNANPEMLEDFAQDRPVPVEDTNAVRDAIIDHYGMTEILSEDGGPAIPLRLRWEPYPEAGWMRIWETPAGCVIDRVYHILCGGSG